MAASGLEGNQIKETKILRKLQARWGCEGVAICNPLVERGGSGGQAQAYGSIILLQGRREACALPIKDPTETEARAERCLAEPLQRATDKPNPAEDLVLAAALPSGSTDVSLWGSR